MPRVAIIQKAPVLLDRDKTLVIAVEAVNEAAAGGAQLIVFPEAFVPGYPAWIWRLRPGGDMALIERLHSALLGNDVELASDGLALLCNAAKENAVTVVCGMHERDTETSRGTLYNTAVIIGTDGSIRNRHRKLMPTNPERMVWGFGDGSKPEDRRHALWTDRDADLLGELYAARALRALCARRGDLHRAHL